MYSPPTRTYMKSPLSQEVVDNFKQPNSISSNNVYSSPMASPVSNKELNIGDHTNMNENLYKNSSSNDYISNGYKNTKYTSKNYMSYNKYQGKPNKDKFRPKKQDKLRQKKIFIIIIELNIIYRLLIRKLIHLTQVQTKYINKL